MERFKAEGIDFAFPTQPLHMAGDDKRPLTVGKRWVSEEEIFFPSAVLSQAPDYSEALFVKAQILLHDLRNLCIAANSK